MRDFYHLIFFHIYKLAIKSGETSVPMSSVVPSLAFLQFCNLASILTLIDIVGVPIFIYISKLASLNFYIIGIGIVLFALNYHYLHKGGLYKKLVRDFSKRTIEERKRGARITLIYALVSIALIFILAPLRVKLM